MRFKSFSLETIYYITGIISHLFVIAKMVGWSKIKRALLLFVMYVFPVIFLGYALFNLSYYGLVSEGGLLTTGPPYFYYRLAFLITPFLSIPLVALILAHRKVLGTTITNIRD